MASRESFPPLERKTVQALALSRRQRLRRRTFVPQNWFSNALCFFWYSSLNVSTKDCASSTAVAVMVPYVKFFRSIVQERRNNTTIVRRLQNDIADRRADEFPTDALAIGQMLILTHDDVYGMIPTRYLDNGQLLFFTVTVNAQERHRLWFRSFYRFVWN